MTVLKTNILLVLAMKLTNCSSYLIDNINNNANHVVNCEYTRYYNYGCTELRLEMRVSPLL